MYNLDIPGWMPELELKVLERLASRVPENGQVVEVGPFVGRSSWCLAKSMPQTATLTCIDIWNPGKHPYYPPAAIGVNAQRNEFGRADTIAQAQGVEANFIKYTADCPNIKRIRGTSPVDFMNWPERSLDMVFLDGVHHNPIFAADLHHWIWRVKPGGMICGDDCARTHPDVLWTIHDTAKDLELQFGVEGRIWMMAVPPAKLFAV